MIIQVMYLQQYQIHYITAKATYELIVRKIIRKILSGPSKAYYLGAQT